MNDIINLKKLDTDKTVILQGQIIVTNSVIDVYGEELLKYDDKGNLGVIVSSKGMVWLELNINCSIEDVDFPQWKTTIQHTLDDDTFKKVMVYLANNSQINK